MNCLDDADLARYLDNEVSNGERAEYGTHLDSCGSCRLRLAESLESEGMLRRCLAGFSAGAADRRREMTCDWPSREHLVLYLRKGLSAEEAEGVERHLQVCDGCMAQLKMLAAIERRSASTPLKTVPEELVKRVQQGWGEAPGGGADQSPAKSAIRLIVGLVAGGLEVLRESLIPPGFTITPLGGAIPAHAFRSPGDEAPPERVEALLLEKRSEGSDVKVELTIRKQGDDRIGLALGLSRNGEPMANVRVSLFKDRHVLLESRKTGPSGFADFTILQPGSYLLRISSEAIEWPIEIRKP